MGFLSSILGGTQAATIPGQAEDAIEVTAGRNKAMSAAENPDAPPLYLGNRSAIEAVTEANANAPERKGMFGVKGTFRDILGTIGDAFLVQSGNKPLYSPRRQQEREADALTGFTQDPMAALERLAAVSPELAANLYKDVQNQQFRQANLASQDAARQSQIQARGDANLAGFANRAGRIWAGTPDKKVARQRITMMSKALGVPFANLGLSDEPTDEELATLAAGDMTVNQTQNLPIAQQNADSRRISATRPPAPRQPPGVSTVDAVVAEKIRTGTASPEEQTYWESRLTKGTKNTKPSRIQTQPKTISPRPGWGRAVTD